MLAGMAVAARSHTRARWTADPLTWSMPELIDADAGLSAVSCPAASLCAAVDSAGNVLTSTDPAGGPSAWHPADIDGTERLKAISCPSTHLCVAVDGHGRVFSSTDPTRGAAAWHVTKIDHGRLLDAISCSSTRLCVAGDDEANFVTSRDPTGAARSWHTTPFSPKDYRGNLDAISCPSTRLCVALDGDEAVATSRDPTGDTRAWRVTPIATVDTASALSCPSTRLCVAVGETLTEFGVGAVSTDPTGRPRAWRGLGALDSESTPGLFAVSCASVSLCVAVGNPGTPIVSTDPTSSATWRRVDGGDMGELIGVSCVPSLCVAVDASGHVIVGTRRAG
jgi:hypothetical protein